jgi:hypothetical protein
MADLTQVHQQEIENLVTPLSEVTDRAMLPPPIIHAFVVSSAALQGPGLAMKTLYDYLLAALDTNPAPWLDTLTLLGFITQVVPQDGMYVAHIVQHPATMEPGEDEARHLLSILLDPSVFDAIINSGLLHAEEHVAYGRSVGGMLSDIVLYVLAG